MNIKQFKKETSSRFDKLMPEDWTEKGVSRLEIKHFLDQLIDDTIKQVLEGVGEFIKCKDCKGGGILLGRNLGVEECNECGGDGHCLHGDFEGESLEEIITKLAKEIEG